MSDIFWTTAIILAGGLGTRLRTVVSDRPKAMAEINGKPFLSYLLDQLVEMGVERVVISTGYLAHVVEEIIGTSYKGLQVRYSREEIPLGTAGALKLAGQSIDTEYCLVMNGDSFIEFDLISLIKGHKKSEASVTVVIKAVDDTSRYGTILLGVDNNIMEFVEKNSIASRGLVNAGVYMMNTDMLDSIPNKIPCSLEHDFFPQMVGRKIYGHETKGKFIDIGTPESFSKAEEFFNSL